jgi:hypothetical protein
MVTLFLMTETVLIWTYAIGCALLACATAAFLEAGWQAWRHRHHRTRSRHWFPTFTSVWPDED